MSFCVYQIPMEPAIDALIALVQKPHIRVTVMEVDNDRAIEALWMCRSSGRVSPTDAMIWALALRHGKKVWTFDRNFPAEGIAICFPDRNG